MILYRRHSAELQKKIEEAEKNGTFVQDTSRKFNKEGKKNQGELYFYSLEISEEYKQWDREFEERIDKLYTYEVSDDVKLLDLRVVENREKCALTVNYIYKEELRKMQQQLTHYKETLSNSKKKKDITLWTKLVSEVEKEISNWSKEKVLNDIKSSSTGESESYWGQRASDFECGIELRKDLQRLGYEGVVFSESWETAKPEVALLLPAKLINEKEKNKTSKKRGYNAYLIKKKKKGIGL